MVYHWPASREQFFGAVSFAGTTARAMRQALNFANIQYFSDDHRPAVDRSDIVPWHGKRKNVTARKHKEEETHSSLLLGFEPILEPQCVASVLTSARAARPATATAPAIATETTCPPRKGAG